MSIRERKIYYDSIGNVTFRKSVKARRLTIRVNNDGQVRVTIPYLVSLNKASIFVKIKTEWIQQIQQKIKQAESKKTLFNEGTEFYTTAHKVIIRRCSGLKIRKEIQNGSAMIYVPDSEDMQSQKIQESIRMIITEIWRIEAKEVLVSRIYELAGKYGFTFNQVKIKNMKTRWGSCSGKNIINLNLHLVRLPQHLQDYVILHELVHTKTRNHGRVFWEQLNKVIGDGKKLSRELRNNEIGF